MADETGSQTEMSVLQDEIAKIKAKIFGDDQPPPGLHEVRMNNLAELKAERAAYVASWEGEDAAYKAAKDGERKAVMASFDRGLAAFVATTNINASWDDTPASGTEDSHPA